jgi:hypothetical protein
MRRSGSSEIVPAGDPTDISTFHGVVSLVLRDGQITREEKRLVIKLAGLLELDEDEPKRVYDAVISGEVAEEGRVLGKKERMRVYAELFKTAFLNASISEDEYLVVAYLRHILNITDEDHDQVALDMQKSLEEHVDKGVFDVVEKGFDQALDKVNGIFLKIRSILPEGGR